jgi:hypothetical protein
VPEDAQLASPKNLDSFANFLATLTGKLQDEWDNSALADDVATLTYDKALRQQCQSGIPQLPADSLLDGTPQPSERRSCSKKELSQRSRLNSTLKTASITIRLTAEEQAQLHERAAAAQLSVSAYLRSCIFEAEALRIQVREALSQLRAATPNDPVEPVQSQAQSARSWRSRLLPLWRSHASARV